MTSAPAMHDDGLVTATTPAIARVLPHATGLLICAAVSVVVGRPEGWIGVFAAIGPLLGASLARLFSGRTPAWREAQAFALVIATMTAGGWSLLRLVEVSELFVFVWPIALLALLLGVVNFVLVSISRTYRAARNQPLDYPWIPPQLARILGIPNQGAT